MATPMGENLLVEFVYRACEVFVCEKDTLAHLMLLDMANFDVILGMGWLESCHATLDCHSKVLNFSILGKSSFSFQGDQSIAPNNLISILSVQRLLRKEFHNYLALVKDVEKEAMSLDQVSVLREFTDVFPKELPGLPPIEILSLVLCDSRDSTNFYSSIQNGSDRT